MLLLRRLPSLLHSTTPPRLPLSKTSLPRSLATTQSTSATATSGDDDAEKKEKIEPPKKPSALQQMLQTLPREAKARLYAEPSVSRVYAEKPSVADFFDVKQNAQETLRTVGTAWRIDDLRKKSFEDLHRLHFVLLVERNKLLAERHRARKAGSVMNQPERLKKVRQSMARLQTVITENRRLVKMEWEKAKSEGRVFEKRRTRVASRTKEVESEKSATETSSELGKSATSESETSAANKPRAETRKKTSASQVEAKPSEEKPAVKAKARPTKTTAEVMGEKIATETETTGVKTSLRSQKRREAKAATAANEPATITKTTT